MTLEEMFRIKEEKKYSCKEISARTGVPYRTVLKIFSKKTEYPRYNTLRQLELLFCPAVQAREPYRKYYYNPKSEPRIVVQERFPEGYIPNTQGEHVEEDLARYAPEERVELIDGKLIFNEAPSVAHQQVIGNLYFRLRNYIEENHGSCKVFTAPIDTWLDIPDEHNVLEPDLCVVCDPEKIGEKHLNGAPDFVLEVVSPSTKKRDYREKMTKYMAAGTREYWVADPERHSVVVYLGDDPMPRIYPDNSEIPVDIYEGKLVIKSADLWL